MKNVGAQEKTEKAFMSFSEKYMHWKYDGLTDNEICKILNIHRSTLLRMKKMYDIPLIINRKNVMNIPEQQIKIGMMKGLSRRIIMRRVRDYGWTVLDAIHIPKQVKRRKKKS